MKSSRASMLVAAAFAVGAVILPARGAAAQTLAAPAPAHPPSRRAYNPDVLPPNVLRFPRGVRIALELVTVNFMGAAGGAAGFYFSYAVSDCIPAPTSSSCALARGIGVGVGSVLGAFLGASAGYLMDGDGSAWATLLGASIGAVPLATAMALGVTGPTLLLLLPTPYLGAMLGFELTSQDHVGEPVRRTASWWRWAPMVAPTAGGAVIGVIGVL